MTIAWPAAVVVSWQGPRLKEPGVDELVDRTVEIFDSAVHEEGRLLFGQASRGVEQEYGEDKRFCDIFDAGHIKPHPLNAMVLHHAILHGPSTKGFLKTVGPVMQKLASWLSEKGFWTEEDRRWYGELVGDKPGRDLPDCEQFAAILDRIQRFVVPPPLLQRG